jgi:hypothetical protein
VHSNRTAAEKAALADRLYKENMAKIASDPDQAPSAASRRGLDVTSAQRLLYGSLGVRRPKTQEQKNALQKKLAGRQGTEMPKRKASTQAEQPKVTEKEAEADDENAWLQRIDLRAVECCEEGVELSTPPFPFYQRWDAQYRKKKNRNMSSYATAPRKRRRGNQAAIVGELMESYDKYNQDGYGDVLDYDGDGGGDDDYWEEGALLDDDQDDLAEQQLLNEVNANVPVDDFPQLPADVSTLASLAKDEARNGDYITYVELVCSPATSWQPKMVTRTVQLVEKEDGGESWKVKLAVRDLAPKEYDDEGNRVYGKFEMAGMSDDEGDGEEDERIKTMVLGDLSDVRLLLRAEAEQKAAEE